MTWNSGAMLPPTASSSALISTDAYPEPVFITDAERADETELDDAEDADR